MSIKQREGGFLKQASILAAAGIIVRVIGMLYRSPLTAIIGDEGNGYYSTAYNIYTMVLLISSYSIPTAVSKLVAGKLALKQYRNAHRTFLCALVYVFLIGGAAAGFTYLLAPVLVSSNQNAIPALRILAPTIFFSGLLGVLRGYFQAHNTMVPTSLSQIIEQIFNAAISIFAAWYFTKDLIGADLGMIPVHGAAGGALGTGIGVLGGLCFLLFAYAFNYPVIRRRMAADGHAYAESYRSISKSIMWMVTPVIFSTFIYNISTALDMTVFYQIMAQKGMLQKEAASLYGVFSGKYMVLINVPVAMASAMSTAMIPSISASFVRNELSNTRKSLADSVRFTMLISIPSAVGLGVLARPIMQLLFPQPETIRLASGLLTAGCAAVLLYALSTVTNGALQGIGKVGVPVRNAFIALVIHIAALVPMLYFTELKLYALLIATVLYAFLMCILNSISVKKYLGYRQEIKRTFLLPGIAALIMGAVAWLAYQGIYKMVHSNFISLMLAVFIAVMVYFAVLIKLKGVGEKELLRLPKGKMILWIAEKCRLL